MERVQRWLRLGWETQKWGLKERKVAGEGTRLEWSGGCDDGRLVSKTKVCHGESKSEQLPGDLMKSWKLT